MFPLVDLLIQNSTALAVSVVEMTECIEHGRNILIDLDPIMSRLNQLILSNPNETMQFKQRLMNLALDSSRFYNALSLFDNGPLNTAALYLTYQVLYNLEFFNEYFRMYLTPQ